MAMVDVYFVINLLVHQAVRGSYYTDYETTETNIQVSKLSPNDAGDNEHEVRNMEENRTFLKSLLA